MAAPRFRVIPRDLSLLQMALSVPIRSHLQEEKMHRINTLVSRFAKNDEAATMVEYALMLSLIAVVCIIAVTLVGTNANNIFNAIAAALPG